MALFGKNKRAESVETCPLCEEVLNPQVALVGHAFQHVVQIDEGWGWECDCGEQDGIYELRVGAADTLANHLRSKHGDRFGG